MTVNLDKSETELEWKGPGVANLHARFDYLNPDVKSVQKSITPSIYKVGKEVQMSHNGTDKFAPIASAHGKLTSSCSTATHSEGGIYISSQDKTLVAEGVCSKMFFIKELSHTINLHPSFFGPRTEGYLKEKLNRDVEGTCTGRFGYIIAVLTTLTVSAGTIQPGTGMAEFVIKYSAIVLKPFKGEVVDGIVGQVNKMGFFVEVGPLQAFVSSHLIPSDLKFDPNANPPCFSSDEDQATIEKGTRIRLKIVGTRVDATEIFAIGTIKEDYLGPID
ncbi:hypothetical protein PCASD_21154 [Puccinia coronata f. sp. avenae]|uniref:S1 motif domain-containing protein n=1 Tax=Puccinia coronata f. sp. avenae TaxID=200324 RepID=A0A2N5S1D9_9BASI|nr:hypothetical protein PCASD_21154 [Puccinia coronata f. sp. avenae]